MRRRKPSSLLTLIVYWPAGMVTSDVIRSAYWVRPGEPLSAEVPPVPLGRVRSLAYEPPSPRLITPRLAVPSKAAMKAPGVAVPSRIAVALPMSEMLPSEPPFVSTIRTANPGPGGCTASVS